MEDNELLAKLSMGDMPAFDAKYRSKCLLALYNRAKATADAKQKAVHESGISRRVLAKLVL